MRGIDSEVVVKVKQVLRKKTAEPSHPNPKVLTKRKLKHERPDEPDIRKEKKDGN